MNNTNDIITGVIRNLNKQRIAFVSDRFRFTLVNIDESLTDVALIPDNAGYIWGTILRNGANKTIAIFVGRPIHFQAAFVFTTWNYIVMDIRPSVKDDGFFEFPGFRGIRFFNGSLMSVNPPWALHEDREKEEELNAYLQNMGANKTVGGESGNINEAFENVSDNGDDSGTVDPFKYIVYREYANEKKFKISNDGHNTEWIFGSEIKNNMSWGRGISLENTNSVLEIRFDESKRLQVFNEYYEYLTKLLSFLTFRRSAPFERIQLLYSENQYGFRGFADCFVNSSEDSFADQDKESTGNEQIRDFSNSISVHIISDETFEQLIKSIQRSDKKTIDLPLAIVPNDNRDTAIISAEKIKNICSSLEVEMDAAGIKLNKGDELENLISRVKDLIKNYRDGEDNSLMPKTYDNMFNSISHWGDSLADRAVEAWRQNEAFLFPWLKIMQIEISDEDIAAVVKARNDITHRGFQRVEENIGTTSYALRGLVYVLALKRMKVSDELIHDIMIRRVAG